MAAAREVVVVVVVLVAVMVAVVEVEEVIDRAEVALGAVAAMEVVVSTSTTPMRSLLCEYKHCMMIINAVVNWCRADDWAMVIVIFMWMLLMIIMSPVNERDGSNVVVVVFT